MTALRELPKYQSHKQVWALKVKEVMCKSDRSEGAIIPEDEGYAPIPVTGDYLKKHNPQPGGYYVVYPDGYKSWSPAEAFESGYTRIQA
jgi:hypothetical protein